MHKMIAALSLSCLSSVCAMDGNLASKQTSILQREMLSKPGRKTVLKDVCKRYNEYKVNARKDLRVEIINELNSLLQRNKLQGNDIERAKLLAKILNAPSLLTRLERIGQAGEGLGVLTADILHIILEKVSEGMKAKDVVAFLTISKGFNRLLLDTPLFFDLSPYKDKITDEIIGTLVTLFPNLQSLNLSHCYKVTDEGLKYLASLKNLKSLDLFHCYSITDKGLTFLKSLINLRSLNVGYSENITDDGLTFLGSLINLQSLGLENCKNITDKGIAPLASLTNLRSLSLADSNNITNDGLTSLTSLTNLQFLNLTHCHDITDAGLISLAS